MGKFKVILVCERSGVLPLGPGCLKAFAEADPRLAALADVSLVYLDDISKPDELIAMAPDLAGFSCCGGLTAVFTACAKLKELAPALPIVLGGPAVSAIGAEELFSGAPFDFAVRGEGEAVFRDLVLSLAGGGRGEGVPGLICRRGGALAENPPGPALSTRLLPSPYLSGVFDLSRHSKFFVEGSRGCGFRCRYCAESTAALRWFGAGRLRKEVAYILEHAPNASIIAPTDADFFLDRARAKSLLKTFRSIGGKRRLTFVFACNTRSWDAEIMKALDCERFRLSVGVQSMNPAALKAAGRPGGAGAIKRKMRELLRLAPGARFSLDLIEGLPGDDLAGYARTLDWAVSTGGDIEMNHLMVLRGTAFASQKERFGIKCDNTYPYSVISTRTFPAAGIKRAKALNARVWPILRRFSLDRFVTFSVLRLGAALRGAAPLPYLEVCGGLADFMRRRPEFSALEREWHRAGHGGYSGASNLRARGRALELISVFSKGLLAKYGRKDLYPAFAGEMAAARARLAFREGAAQRGAAAARLCGGDRPALLVCQADSDEPRFFPGCRAVLVNDFFSDETWGGREGPAGVETVQAGGLAEHFKKARAGFSGPAVVSGVLSGLPASGRKALLVNLSRLSRAGGSLLVFDDLAGAPGMAARRPLNACRLRAELAAAGWTCAEPALLNGGGGTYVFDCRPARRPAVRKRKAP